MRRRFTPDIGLALVLMAGAVWRFARLGASPLTAEEAAYWVWSTHLRPAYAGSPAGVAWLLRAGVLFAGESELGLRWLPAVLGVGSVALAYLVARRLYGRGAAFLNAALIGLGAPYLLASRYVSMGGPLLFFLLLSLWVNAPLPEKASPPAWRFVALGLAVALLLNVTYDAYVIAVAMMVAALWGSRGDVRALARERRNAWTVGLALAGLLPAVIANASHGLASWTAWFHQFVDSPSTLADWRTALSGMADRATFPVLLVSVAGLGRLGHPESRRVLWPGILLATLALASPVHGAETLCVALALLCIPGADAVAGWAARSLAISRDEARPAIAVILRWAILLGLAVSLALLGGALGRAALARVRGEAFGWSNALEREAWGPFFYVAIAALFALLLLVMRALQSPQSSRADVLGIARALGWFLPIGLIVVNSAFGLGALSQALGPDATSRLAPALARLPHNHYSQQVHADTHAWHRADPGVPCGEGTLLVIDDTRAARLAYYTGRPVYNLEVRFGQALLPADLTIVASADMPPAEVSTRLQTLYAAQRGPYRLALSDELGLLCWQVTGLQRDAAEALRALGLAALLQDTPPTR